MQPSSPPAPSAPSPVRPPALNKEWLQQMQQQQQQQQQDGDDSVREPTVQTNQALTLIYAGRPTAALASSAHTQHRQHPSDGTGTSSHSTADSRSTSPLPLLDDEESLAMYYKKLEEQQQQQHQQQQQRHQHFVSDGQEEEDGGWEEGEEEEEEEDDEQQSKGMFATCTTFASRFPGEQEEGEPAPSSILEDERVTELLELERFEKSIFVKAALQLLLDKAGSGGSSSSSSCDYSGGGGGGGAISGVGIGSSNSTNTPASTKTAGRVSLSLSVAPPPDDAALPISLSLLPPSSSSSTSILKAGLLKKANHHAMGAIWKTKFVEVHQGLFVYEDDDSLMGRRRKTLPLHASICSCKPVASKKNNVFELALKKGAKRLWMCTSEEERNGWVHAINSATVVLPPGRGVGGQAIDPSSPYAGDMVRYRDLRISVEGAEDRESYQRAVSSLLEKEELCVPFPWIRGQIFPASSSSSTGSVAPSSLPFYLKYARRRSLHPHHPNHHNLHSPSAPYHHHNHQHQHSSASGAGSSSSSSSSSGSSALTQLWKDMMRDKVCINGQIIYGESGPEAILGVLARALSTLAQKAKEHEQEEASRSLPGSLGGLSLGAAAAAAAGGGGIGSPHHTCVHSTHHMQHHHQHRLSSSVAEGFPPPLSSSSSSSSFSPSPRPPLSALNEVQVVSHTMEILLACNRTQSGGDTYYCVEYLFRNPQLVVVCPYSSHAEPLQISLELVEEESVMSVVSPPPSLHSPLIMSPEQPEEEKGGSGGGGGHRYSFALRGSRARGSGSASSSPQRWQRADSLPTQLLQSGPTTEAAASSPVSPPQQQQHQQPVPARALSPSSTFSRTLPLSAPAGGRQQLQQTGGHFYDFESPGRSSSSSPAGGGSSPLSDVEQRPISSGAAATAATAASSSSGAIAAAAPTTLTGSLRRPVILVKIQANTSYKVCPLDPQDGDDNDIWGLVSARFEQQFIVSGAGLAKSDELIRLKTTSVNNNNSSSGSSNNAEKDNQTNRPLSASTLEQQQQQQQQQGGGNVLSTPPRPSSSGGKAGEQDQQQQQQQQQRQQRQQRQTTAGCASPPDGAT